jgi:hypothetical protein
MAFSRKIHHGIRLVTVEQIADQASISYIAMNEEMTAITAQRLEGIEVAGIRQQVEIYDTQIFILRKASQHIVTADETSATGDE